MGTGILRIYKCDHHNRNYTPPNTTFVIPQCSETSLKTQHTSDCDASMGAHALSYSGLYQSTNHHGNNDVNDNDDS